MRISRLFLIVLLLSVFTACRDEDPEIDSQADLETYIQEEFEDQDLPALAVLAFTDDQIIYEGYFGHSDGNETKDLLPEDMFLIASISKVVTGVALLQLYDDNAFDLDDDINSYLPFPVRTPDHPNAPITFRMLLTHSSGIADGPALEDEYYFGEDSPKTLNQFLEDYLVPGGADYDERDNFHGFVPGTDYEYSNVGSALVGYLVESISGQPFDEYCEQHIFTPLGMTQTAWRLEDINSTIVQPIDRRDGVIDHYTFTDYPNGGLRTTPRDLMQLFKIFSNSGSSNGQQILSVASVNEMMTAQIPQVDNEVGLHLFLMDASNDVWGHDGSERGVSTYAGINSTNKTGVIVFCNYTDADLETIFDASYDFAVAQ